MTLDSGIVVGSRVESEGYHGTVRFIGPVPPTKGEWLGVEWDDSTRGKHDGTHQGVRYFTTRHGRKSGTFVRHQKVSSGVTLMEALQERYGETEDEYAGVQHEDLFVIGHNQQTTRVEMVGAKSVNKKQSQFNQLRELAFRKMSVNGEPSDVDISKLLQNLRLLDLSQNLLPSWTSVARITRGMANLQVLNLSANRLEISDDTETSQKMCECFSPVRTLMLNRMEYDWEKVQSCCAYFNHLDELHVCINEIHSLTPPGLALQQLRVLNVEANAIGDWKHILVLGHLQNLETLIVNECRLPCIYFDDVEVGDTTKYFRNLRALHIKNNRISEWKSINELNKLAHLESLILIKNPLNEPTKEMNEITIRSVMIAKLQYLKLLNRSEITGEERKGSELDYMKMNGKAWREAGGNQDPVKNQPSADFCQQHPRYMTLVKKCGPPEDSELVQYSSALKNALIELTFKCPDVPGKKELKKKIPVTFTVQKLKALAAKLYRAELADMNITYTSHKVSGQEFELDSDQKDIGYYSVENGDILLVRWQDG